MEYVDKVNTPCYVIDKQLLIKNLEILKYVREQSGCKILLAQKAFSMYSVYPLIMQYLDGTAASGLYEAMLGREEAGEGEVHVYSPAFKKDDMAQLVRICDHIVFNSPSQYKLHRAAVESSGRKISLQEGDPCPGHTAAGTGDPSEESNGAVDSNQVQYAIKHCDNNHDCQRLRSLEPFLHPVDTSKKAMGSADPMAWCG